MTIKNLHITHNPQFSTVILHWKSDIIDFKIIQLSNDTHDFDCW